MLIINYYKKILYEDISTTVIIIIICVTSMMTKFLTSLKNIIKICTSEIVLTFALTNYN